MSRILIIGATSAIAVATARLWAKDGHRIYLCARNEERVANIAADLAIRGAEATHFGLLDLNDIASHSAFIANAISTLGGLDTVLIAHGSLGDQKACEREFNLALKEINTNAISVFSLLTYLANFFEKEKCGIIAVITSVAGDRGRQSNYIYGAAKGAVSIFLQGLRQRLFKSGVRVLTIKPGFVDTPMTAGMKKGFMWTKPESVARRIHSAVASDRTEVVYAPAFWAPIMWLVRSIPEFLFKRLEL